MDPDSGWQINVKKQEVPYLCILQIPLQKPNSIVYRDKLTFKRKIIFSWWGASLCRSSSSLHLLPSPPSAISVILFSLCATRHLLLLLVGEPLPGGFPARQVEPGQVEHAAPTVGGQAPASQQLTLLLSALGHERLLSILGIRIHSSGCYSY